VRVSVHEMLVCLLVLCFVQFEGIKREKQLKTAQLTSIQQREDALAMRLSATIKDTCKQVGIDFHNIPTEGSRLSELIQLSADLYARMIQVNKQLDGQAQQSKIQQIQQQSQPADNAAENDENEETQQAHAPMNRQAHSISSRWTPMTNLPSSNPRPAFLSSTAAENISHNLQRSNSVLSSSTSAIGGQFRRANSPIWGVNHLDNSSSANSLINRPTLVATAASTSSPSATHTNRPHSSPSSLRHGHSHSGVTQSQQHVYGTPTSHPNAGIQEVSQSKQLASRLKKAQQAFAAMREPL
jgi:hypothetical protein